MSFWLDPAKLQAEVEKHNGFKQAGRANGCSDYVLRKHWDKHGLPPFQKKPGVGQWQSRPVTGDDGVEIDVATLGDIGAELAKRGLNPDDWTIIRVIVNTWDGFLKDNEGEPVTVPLKQLKVYLRPKVLLDWLFPASDVKPIAQPRKPDKSKPRLVVFVGDEQEPYSDPVLKELFLRWLAHNQPAEGVHLGDLLDFPTISRHRDNPVYNANPQECINAGYATLRAYREASPDTAWRLLRGNHDDRLRTEQLTRAERIYGLRPADVDGERFEQALSLRRLLHLDALGIEYVGDDGGYEHTEIEVAPNLVARHGWITGNNSADKTLRRIGCDVVVGHTHRQRITWATETRRGQTLTMQAVEAGCMCRIDGGLGYVVNPDWQAGFATAVVWPDGHHVIEHATFVDGVLRWRDQRFSAGKVALAA